MTTSTQWQLGLDAAERYERIVVPTILGPAARALVEFAALSDGESVLDVGCGTGAAARYAAEKVGRRGFVVGIDVNPGMVAVAESLPPIDGASVEWRVGSADDLPFAEGQLDQVLCAQTLQFLDRPERALAEMHRVLKPGGRAAVSLWCDLRENPYFHAVVRSTAERMGEETAMGLRSAFRLSDLTTIHALLDGAGFKDRRTTEKELDVELPSLVDFVPRHISATPMARGFQAATREQQHAVVEDIRKELAGFIAGLGVRVPFRTYLVQGTK